MSEYQFIDDNTLSIKAKGMMALLIKYPDASVRDLMKYTSEGKTAIYNALKELEAKGFVRSHQSGSGKPKREIFPNGPKQ